MNERCQDLLTGLRRRNKAASQSFDPPSPSSPHVATMTTPRQRAPHATGTWTPSPSPSPPPSPPLTLTDAERLLLLSTHGPLKPSSLPAPNASPLLFLNPTELEELAEREKVEWEEEGEVLLWEELANDLLWTVPFGFLYSGMYVLIPCAWW